MAFAAEVSLLPEEMQRVNSDVKQAMEKACRKCSD